MLEGGRVQSWKGVGVRWRAQCWNGVGLSAGKGRAQCWKG